MPASRRKQDIRNRAAAECAWLRSEQIARAALAQPRGGGWHQAFLTRLCEGASVEKAAQAAGVTRAGVRWARMHNPRFARAYHEACGAGLRARWKRRACELATNGSTTR